MNASIPYSFDLFCNDVPEGSPLRRWLEPVGKEGDILATPSRPYRSAEGGVQMATWLRGLVAWRPHIDACPDAYISIGYFPDCRLAECSTRIPAAIIRLLADCGVGLEVAHYPHGSEATRFGGENFFIVATEGEGDEVELLPAVRRALRRRGRRALACLDFDLSFADAPALIAGYIKPEQGPRLLSLNKYLGTFLWPTFWLHASIIAALAAQGSELELHVSFPQRRGKRVSVVGV